MKKLLLFVFLSSFGSSMAQNFYTLRGYVYDDQDKPLIGASLRLFDKQLGTQTNPQGQYELVIEEGFHRLTISYLGYESQTIEIGMESDKVQNFFMIPDQQMLNEVVVNVKKKDYSYEVIQNVIDNKEKYRNQFQNFRCDTYIKSAEEIKGKKPSKKPKPDEEESLLKKDSLPDFNFFEATIERYQQSAGGKKEIRNGVKKIGDQQSLYFTSITDGEFDLYQNLQQLPKLSENNFVSPISSLGFLSYKFELLETYYEGSRPVYRIAVKPRKLGNALYEGSVDVYGGVWVLKSANLKLSPKALLFYDQFSFQQSYTEVQDRWVITKARYDWEVKEGGTKYKGATEVEQSNFVFDSTYAKRFFGNELGVTTQEAYKKDSTFWENIRPKPLPPEERKFVRDKELQFIKENSKEYLDSVDTEYNRITALKVLWQGVGRINRAKKSEWFFNSLPTLLNPVAIGGWRVNYSVFYRKRFENRKEFFIRPYINYGFLNRDLQGAIDGNWLYNPLKRSSIEFSVGKGFDVINGAATIADIARRSNFYINTGLNFRHRTELLNGLYLNAGLQVNKREDLADFRFTEFGDDLFGGENSPAAFPTTFKYETSLGLSYTPGQQYVLEPNEKVILGSNYPTFTANIRKAWAGPNTQNSDFTALDFSVYQYFNVGVLGTSEYKVSAGKFLDTTRLSPMDFKFQRGGDRWWLSPTMSTYQLIPETFATLDWYFESHYEHQFNGFLTSKIPLINKTGIRAVAGAGFLYVPDQKYQYSEFYFGINRVFKVGRTRFRLGAYNVTAQSDQFGVRNQFKFSFEPYNRDRNSWSF